MKERTKITKEISLVENLTEFTYSFIVFYKHKGVILLQLYGN